METFFCFVSHGTVTFKFLSVPSKICCSHTIVYLQISTGHWYTKSKKHWSHLIFGSQDGRTDDFHGLCLSMPYMRTAMD